MRERYDIRWVDRERLHLTLLFAGELPDENTDALCDIVANLKLPPLQLALNGFGAFPPKGMPRVVWAGLAPDEQLSQLQLELTERAEPLGVTREKRGFAPHVTLGRVQGRFGLLALIDELQKLGEELNTKPFAPPSLTLYRSTLTPKGPEYDVMLRLDLPH